MTTPQALGLQQKIPFLSVFFQQWKATRPLLFLFLAVLLPVCGWHSLSRLGSLDQLQEAAPLFIGAQSTFFSVGFAGMVLVSILLGVQQFSYLYHRQQVDFYHSLPASRSTLFWGRYFAGLLTLQLPLLCEFLLLLLLGLGLGCLDGQVLFFLLRAWVTSFFFSAALYSFFLSMMIVSASVFQAVLSFAVGLLSLPAILYCAGELLTLTIPGSASLFFPSQLVYEFLGPMYNLDTTDFRSALVLLVAGIGLTLWGHRAFLKRGSENSYPHTKGKVAISLLGCSAAGLFCGRTVYHNFYYTSNFESVTQLRLLVGAAFLLGSALAYFLLQGVLFSSFRPQVKRLVPYLCFPLLLALYLGVLSTGLGLDSPRLAQGNPTSVKISSFSQNFPDIIPVGLGENPKGWQGREVQENWEGETVSLSSAFGEGPLLEQSLALENTLYAYEKAKAYPYFLGRDFPPRHGPTESLPLDSLSLEASYATPPIHRFTFFRFNHSPDQEEAQAQYQQILSTLNALTNQKTYRDSLFPLNAIEAATSFTLVLPSGEVKQVPNGQPRYSTALPFSRMEDQAAFRKKLEQALEKDLTQALLNGPWTHQKNGSSYTRSTGSQEKWFVLNYPAGASFTARGGTVVASRQASPAAGKAFTLLYDQSVQISSSMTETTALLEQAYDGFRETP